MKKALMMTAVVLLGAGLTGCGSHQSSQKSTATSSAKATSSHSSSHKRSAKSSAKKTSAAAKTTSESSASAASSSAASAASSSPASSDSSSQASASSSSSSQGRVIKNATDARRLAAHADGAPGLGEDPNGPYQVTEVDGGYRVVRTDYNSEPEIVHYDGSITYSDGETLPYSQVSAPLNDSLADNVYTPSE